MSFISSTGNLLSDGILQIAHTIPFKQLNRQRPSETNGRQDITNVLTIRCLSDRNLAGCFCLCQWSIRAMFRRRYMLRVTSNVELFGFILVNGHFLCSIEHHRSNSMK